MWSVILKKKFWFLQTLLKLKTSSATSIFCFIFCTFLSNQKCSNLFFNCYLLRMHPRVRIHLAHPSKIDFYQKMRFCFSSTQKLLWFCKILTKTSYCNLYCDVSFIRYVFCGVIINRLRYFKSTLIKNPVYNCAVISWYTYFKYLTNIWNMIAFVVNFIDFC